MSRRESIPFNARIAEYQTEAESLYQALKSSDETAEWRFKWVHPDFRGKSIKDVRAATLELADAQIVIARDYGFETWDLLKTFTGKVKTDGPVRRFETAVEAVISGDTWTLRSLLQQHRELLHARSTRKHHATLLHYIAANGVEGCRQQTPKNALEVARLLLEGGADVDALADMYDQQCTTMSMLVSSCHPAKAGLQGKLAEMLIDFGAALEGPGSKWQSALMTALAFGYLDTAETLARRGAPIDNVAASAGLGRVADTVRMLKDADPQSRHIALALAAQHGQKDVVQILLDDGEDPNRLNPEGFHPHSTPLHQAVCAGQTEVVKLLVKRGARLDLRDTIYAATPLSWATYCEKPEIAEYLRAQGATT